MISMRLLKGGVVEVEENKPRATFVFYSEWLDSIEGLSVEQQDKIIGEWARHGCKRPLKHLEDEPLLSSFAAQRFGAIDASQDKYERKVAAGKMGGRRTSYDMQKALEMKKSGLYTNQEVADAVGVSISTINHLKI